MDAVERDFRSRPSNSASAPGEGPGKCMVLDECCNCANSGERGGTTVCLDALFSGVTASASETSTLLPLALTEKLPHNPLATFSCVKCGPCCVGGIMPIRDGGCQPR